MLNDTGCRKAKPEAKPHKLSDGGGLFLLVTPNGSKWWRFRYRFEGREQMLSLGTYPDISLKVARHQKPCTRRASSSQVARAFTSSIRTTLSCMVCGAVSPIRSR